MNDKITVPEGMLKAAIAQALASGKSMNRRQWTEFFSSSDPTCVKFTKDIIESVLRWQIENWGTAPNIQRMPDIWYAKSKEKWDKFKSQWGAEHKIPFVDLLIFFVTLYHESFLAPEPEHKDGTVVWRDGTTIPVGVWAGGKMYTTNVSEPEVPEKIKELLADSEIDEYHPREKEKVEKLVVEAYRLGQQSIKDTL